MTTPYARYISETSVEYPTAQEFVGIPNWERHDYQLRKRGYLSLIGTPEDRDGFTATPVRFELGEQSETRTVPVLVVVDDYEEDQKTHELVKTGTHEEWHEQEQIFDTSYIRILEWRYDAIPAPTHTLEEYDNAMEEYLRQVRFERGYTTREPSDYAESSVAEWKTDARVWIEFRDRVMEYALDVLNQYKESGEEPCTLEQFVEHLHTIKCNWN